MKNNKEKDVYDLINSKSNGNYCREIQHKFNTKEIAVMNILKMNIRIII